MHETFKEGTIENQSHVVRFGMKCTLSEYENTRTTK